MEHNIVQQLRSATLDSETVNSATINSATSKSATSNNETLKQCNINSEIRHAAVRSAP